MDRRGHTPDETEDPTARRFLWLLLLMPVVVFAGWLVAELVIGR